MSDLRLELVHGDEEGDLDRLLVALADFAVAALLAEEDEDRLAA